MFRRNIVTVTSNTTAGALNFESPTNTSLDFNGTTHKLATASAHAELGGLTANNQTPASGLAIVMWIYPHSDGEGNAGTIISKGKWFVQTTGETTPVSGDGNVKIKITRKRATQDSIWETEAILPLNKWSHLIISIVDYDFIIPTNPYDGNLPLYIDGNLYYATNTQTATGDPVSDASDKLFIGAINALGGSAYDGLIADLAVLKKNINNAHAENYYNQGVYYNFSIFASNLRGWWNMGDGQENASGNVIYDKKNNSHLTGNSIPFARGIFGTQL